MDLFNQCIGWVSFTELNACKESAHADENVWSFLPPSARAGVTNANRATKQVDSTTAVRIVDTANKLQYQRHHSEFFIIGVIANARMQLAYPAWHTCSRFWGKRKWASWYLDIEKSRKQTRETEARSMYARWHRTYIHIPSMPRPESSLPTSLQT